MEIIIIITISGDIIRYDDVIGIEYNGLSIIYTLSAGETYEIKNKKYKEICCNLGIDKL